MVCVIRGAQDRLNRWKNDVHAKWYWWQNENGKMVKVRLAIRPYEICELIFPESAYEDVLATVQPYGTPWFPKPLAFVIRKALKLDPIQKMVGANFTVDNTFIHCTGIGVRKDKYHPDGWEML